MKKIFLFLFLFSNVANAQTTTFRKSFQGFWALAYIGNTKSYSNSGLLYGNRYYHTWGDKVISFPGINVAKYDLNGNLLSNNYARSMYFGVKPFKLVPAGTSIAAIGENGALVSISKYDTTTTSASTPSLYFSGSTWLKINDVQVLQNGDAVVVGGILPSGNIDTVGFYLRVNVLTNSIIAQSTLAVNTATNTQIISIAQMSNGSLFVSGKSNGSAFIGKIGIGSNPQITSAFQSANAKGTLRALNSKKLICHAGNVFTKIDTNLTLLSSATSVSLNTVGERKSFLINNQLYSVGILNYELSVIDTAFASVTSNTYNISGSFFEPDLTSTGNGLFITYLDTTSYYQVPASSNFYTDVNIMKVKNNGGSSCSSPLNYSVTSISVSPGTAITVSSSNVSNNSTVSPPNLTTIVNYTATCQCTVPNTPINTTSLTNLNICSGNNAILSVTGSGVINWYSTPNGTLVLITGTSYTTPILTTGNYTYYAESFTCDNSLRVPITVTVSACTSIKDQGSDDAEIVIYPNPFNGKINLVLGKSEKQVQIFNSIGALIHSSMQNSENTEIDLSKESNGIYFIKIGTVTKKIIKQ